MLPANLEREIESAAAIRNLQARVRRLETLEEGAGCLFLINHQEGTTFSTITVPAIHRHLYVVYSAAAFSPPIGDSIGLRFNSDAGANYEWIRRTVDPTAEATVDDTAATFANIGFEGNASPRFTAGFALIPDYLDATKYKSYVAEGFMTRVAPSAGTFLMKFGGMWKNTDAIISIDIPGTYLAETAFTIYGLC